MEAGGGGGDGGRAAAAVAAFRRARVGSFGNLKGGGKVALSIVALINGPVKK